jgi:outer membrane protein insertion porin family
MPKNIHRGIIGLLLLLLSQFTLSFGQEQAESLKPALFSTDNNGGEIPRSGAAVKKKYTIAEITVSGVEYLDAALLKSLSGLNAGQKVDLPDDPEIGKSLRNLWDQGLFSDISYNITKVIDDRIFLDIHVTERPRLAYFEIKGVAKGQQSELKEKLNRSLVKNRMVTAAMKKDITERIKAYYADKGFTGVNVDIQQIADTSGGHAAALIINIDRGSKVHINQINISGNEAASDGRLKRAMKNTKEMPRISLYPADRKSVNDPDHISFKKYIKSQGYLSPSKTLEALDPYFRWNIFAGSKFNPTKFQEDKEAIISHYNDIGYRDAEIVADTTYFVENRNLNIDLKVKEGKRYYFGDIEWKGNTKYSDSLLSLIVGIKKGDVYNLETFESRLGLRPSMDGGDDIGSLYMDDGYLFFQVTPTEKSIIDDTINYEVVIREGPQATIKNITISGNDRTNDHVLRRELFTLPGNKFSRADIIRSIRQISMLGFIDPEKVNPEPKPNLADGTVDINFNVAEKSSDQLELSAGFGGGIGFTGTVGIVFNNFALRNLFKFKEWDPLPMGDGQKLSLRYQSNGRWYNSLNFSFTEPWLGGKRPTALTVSGVYGRYSVGSVDGSSSSPNNRYLRNFGGGVTLSKRLQWPDNNFIFSYGINYQNYFLKDYELFSNSNFKDGTSNNLFFKLTLARNSVDQPIYPRSGSNINFMFQFTPPYSMFSELNYSEATAQQKYKWIEYHKYRFTAEWYQRIAGDLVLKFAAKYGFLGYYNKDLGYSPFERFQMGGDGLSGFNYFVGRDIISQRGYDVYTQDGTIFNKYTAEIRYPFSLNPSATIFGLAFVEAGNGWTQFKDYNPFNLYRSAGLGVRIYLPMFGLLGLDYGLGIDRLGNGVRFGNAAKFTFMLGFEPD